MNVGYLYFLLPVMFFSIAGVLNVAIGRKIGARKLSLYRQITLIIVGFPIALGLLQKTHLIEKHLPLLLISGILGTMYLISAFYAMNVTTIGISRSFVAVSRTVSSFLIGFFLFQESIGGYDILGMLIIFGGFYILGKVNHEKLTLNDIYGILASLFAGAIFSFNVLVFKIYSVDFTALESAYLLESMNAIFLVIISIFFGRKTIKENFHIPLKSFFVLCAIAPLIIISGYGLAKSINLIPFYIFNTLFVATLVVSIILSWIFLQEKFSFGRGVAMATMIAGCVTMILL